jgi:hypothetical protein
MVDCRESARERGREGERERGEEEGEGVGSWEGKRRKGLSGTGTFFVDKWQACGNFSFSSSLS